MDGGITINFCTSHQPMHFCEGVSYIAENLCIQAAKYLGICPLARHLFALWCPAEGVWFAQSKKLDTTKNRKWDLYFRIRFKPPTIQSLKENTDQVTFDYYFCQVREDFLAGKIPEILHRNMRDRALGLVAADIIRFMLEQKQNPCNVKYNSRDFLPQELKRSPLWDNFLKDPLQKAVSKGWINSKQNVNFVKEMYLQQLSVLVPEYGSEIFTASVDDNGNVYEVILSVDPYHTSQPGLRMRLQKCKGVWTHVCSISDLCYISIMRKDKTVEISRQNGVPQYLQFHKTEQMHSFLSLLDGYYRLTEKWTFNLCKDLNTPSLLNLRAMKCHGPVSTHFALEKLQSKGNWEAGSYLLRECTEKYDTYCLDVCVRDEQQDVTVVSTFKIYLDGRDRYVLEEDVNCQEFLSIHQLLVHYNKNGKFTLKHCIPPSEYDKSNLLLCRPPEYENRSTFARDDCNCVAQCIPHDAVIFFQDSVHEFPGQLTVVRHALLKRSCTDMKDIAVKTLRKEAKVTHLQEFLSQSDRFLFLQSNTIVSTVGMILTQPTALVMEYLPIGPLDLYLQRYENKLKQVDLVEASYHIARALWYLEEQQWCHGKVRCHNILVADHTDNSFKVKLADPGLISYSDADIHWIPPECYNDYSSASRSMVADVYAYGTTLWEIFSYGAKPLSNLSPKEAKEWYVKGNALDANINSDTDIQKLLLECWACDPDSRKRPQAIVRDLNQILYEVYNSRRSHTYASVGKACVPVLSQNSDSKPPTPPSNHPYREAGINNLLNKVFKWQVSVNNNNNYNNFQYNPLSTQSVTSGSSGQSVLTVLTDLGKDSPSVTSNSSYAIGAPDQVPDNPSPSDLSWVIDKEQLTIKGTLGQGFYGEVLRATLTHCSGLTSEEVAVKRIKMTDQSAECFTDLKREIEIMKSLRHKNIVEIKGLVEDPELMLVMEYLKLGSLLAYLQMQRNKLGCKHLLKFASDVAEGMEYLERKHIVHRDLAARNILVASERHVKISDFGLAQFTEDHYYRMRTERNLPIRWYALESITKGKFSHKSDVWSFGITLWEMFSYGENPEIPGVPDTSLNEALQQGQRLGIPANCPGDVYSLMRSCWEKDSHERPSFSEILRQILRLKSELCS